MQSVIQDPVNRNELQTERREEVLIVCLAKGLGGSTRSLVTVLAGLAPGFRRILCTPGDGAFGRLVAKRDLTEARLDIPNRGLGLKGKLSRVEAMVRIAYWMRRHHPFVTAIHANGPEELNIVAPIACFWGKRVVVWSHARDVSPWMRRMRPVIRMLLRKVDVRFAAVSESARDVLVEGGLVRAEEVAIVPNPIDPGDIVGRRTSTSEHLVVGFLGSDRRYKGFQFLPAITEKLRKLPVRWIVFSTERSDQNRATWQELRKLPADLVSFPGKLSDVRDAYAQCDVVFMPSLEESFGRVAAEAMLNGLPVVASDLPAVRTVLGNGAAGLLYPPGDMDAAAEAITALVFDPQLRRDLGSRGEGLARAFEPRAVLAQLTRLYKD